MNELAKRKPLAELQQTPEYQRLTQKQKLWIATYCEGGLVDGNYDPIASTRVAYECKSAEVARVMSYSIMSSIRIVEVLNLHFGTAPIEDFLVQVNRAIRNKKITLAQVYALKLKGDILGIKTRLPGAQREATGVIPQDVLDADKEARKANRKKPVRKPSGPEKKSDYEREAEHF